MTETPKNSETSKRTKSWWSKNWFYITLVLVAVIGGGCAFTLPYYFQREGDNIWSLRQAILAATGGVLAILTLWENRRKNIQEKEKNDQDHTRQVHAERRARYTKAVEQLADEKAPIRLGGVYTLIKLVDEWLADEKTLPNEEKRREEGQIIVNSLCAYIRSSFPLAERHDELTLSYEEYQQKYQDNQGKNQATQSVENSADNSTPKPEEHQDNKQSREEFVRDKSIFREEQEVRQTILSEIEKRLNSNKDKNEDGKGEVKPGTWSYFEYDFSNTVFFYYTQFNYSYFGNPSSFFRATFTRDADFSGATFQEANFYEAEFTWSADFSGVEFTGDANFSRAEFTWSADFSGVEFTGSADFSWAEFTWSADFSWAKFTDAHFFEAKFTKASFSRAKFTEDANFPGAKFTGYANFFGAKFTGNANFPGAKFTGNANFPGAKFTGNANFPGATFEEKPIFERALGDKTYKARFSYKVDPEDYNFEVSHYSPYKIETEEQKYNGIKFIIPKGTELFDPDEPSEQNSDNSS